MTPVQEREILLLDKICDMERIVEGEKKPGMFAALASSVKSVAGAWRGSCSR